MADERKGGAPEGDLVTCCRLGTSRTVAEHLSCPYCFGAAGEVASGDRSRFCDFDPDHDATIFGFPQGVGHLARG